MPTDAVVLFVFEEHWTAALLRAQLLERGVEGVALPRVSIALVALGAEAFAGTFVAVTQQSTLTAGDEATLAVLRAMGALAGTVLVASAVLAAPSGRWDKVLRMPIAFGRVAESVDELLHGSPESELGDPADPTKAGFELRLEAPWPMLRCLRCGGTRHSALPQTRAELGALRHAFATFWVEHATLHDAGAQSS